ncbi:EF-hand domain-containing protein [Myxococcus stipitatus]|uniref:EF-hand domain-containing protein n=1 Tax=Myxococcus stipitatus TaxID=83455 RepID=UPI001F46E04B|nr:EF-hand domain-containing protein [Myxococcus stipitatus]MCE9666491.1 EF-hand domain-containing protein [Myxococcus stipitatus]
MATKKRKSSAAKKSSRRASTAKKATTKKPAAKKAGARKSATKKASARKAAARKAAPRKPAAKKAGAGKPAARKASAKRAPAKRGAARKSTEATSTLTAGAGSPRLAVARETPSAEGASASWEARPTTGSPFVEQVETTSAGVQPLAPEHAAVDELTSSGNELLDIFQRYDRNRTGSIERAEFARLLEALGQNVTDEELEIAVDIVDVDRTGKISWSEFKTWWTSR